VPFPLCSRRGDPGSPSLSFADPGCTFNEWFHVCVVARRRASAATMPSHNGFRGFRRQAKRLVSPPLTGTPLRLHDLLRRLPISRSFFRLGFSPLLSFQDRTFRWVNSTLVSFVLFPKLEVTVLPSSFFSQLFMSSGPFLSFLPFPNRFSPSPSGCKPDFLNLLIRRIPTP